MFYVTSKALSFFVQPSTLLFVALCLGLTLTYSATSYRRGLSIAIIAAAALAIGGLSPISTALLMPLEDRFRFEPNQLNDPNLAGIIVLGGFEDIRVDGARAGLSLNEAGERLTEGVGLARRIGSAKLVFTSHVADRVDGEKFARGLRDFVIDNGIASERFFIEEKARDTYENAVFTHDILKPTKQQRWLLVTSAFHMPRAVGTFRQHGFNVIAYPVDYRTRDASDFFRPFTRIGAGLERLDLAAREWLGLAAYRLTGRSDALFPK